MKGEPTAYLTAGPGEALVGLEVIDPFGCSTTCSRIYRAARIGNPKLGSPGIITYPNPANNQIQVRFDHDKQVEEISIINCRGQILGNWKVGIIDILNLDISGFPSGVYFISARGGADLFTNRFIKE